MGTATADNYTKQQKKKAEKKVKKPNPADKPPVQAPPSPPPSKPKAYKKLVHATNNRVYIKQVVKKELKHIKKEGKRDAKKQNAVKRAVRNALHSRAVARVKKGAAKQTRKLEKERDKVAYEKALNDQGLARAAQKNVMRIYHAEANKLLNKGDGPSQNPYTIGTRGVMTDWMTSDPLLEHKPKKHAMTILDRAVDAAQTRAVNTQKLVRKRVLTAIAQRIQQVSSSRLGKQLTVMESTGTLLQQKKSRAAQKLIIYQAYNDGFGSKKNPYARAYLCQKALKTALDTLHLAKADPKHRNYLCRRKMFEAETKLRIEAAAHAALAVAGKSAKKVCNTMKEAKDQMQVAEYEVKAVKRACPVTLMGKKTSGDKNAKLRQAIRKKISGEMVKQLHAESTKRKVKKSTDKEVNKIMTSAKKAWEDIHNYGGVARKGVSTRPKGASPDP